MTTARGPARRVGRHLTIEQVAERLQVSKRTVQRLVAGGALPATNIAVKTGACRLRVDETDLAEFLAKRRVAPLRTRRAAS